MRYAIYRIHYGLDFLARSIDSVYEHVDRVFVFWSKLPWYKNCTNLPPFNEDVAQHCENVFGTDFINRRKQGFAFPIKDFIYSKNKKNIKIQLRDLNFIDSKKISLLFLFKTKANANRIWKLYVLSKWLQINRLEA